MKHLFVFLVGSFAISAHAFESNLASNTPYSIIKRYCTDHLAEETFKHEEIIPNSKMTFGSDGVLSLNLGDVKQKINFTIEKDEYNRAILKTSENDRYLALSADTIIEIYHSVVIISSKIPSEKVQELCDNKSGFYMTTILKIEQGEPVRRTINF